MSVPAAVGVAPSRIVVGIGELAVAEGESSIVTHALGSCVAVCIWEPIARGGGMLHLLLPESRINPGRADRQPAAFADTGIPLLFQRAYARGLHWDERVRMMTWWANHLDKLKGSVSRSRAA